MAGESSTDALLGGMGDVFWVMLGGAVNSDVNRWAMGGGVMCCFGT